MMTSGPRHSQGEVALCAISGVDAAGSATHARAARPVPRSWRCRRRLAGAGASHQKWKPRRGSVNSALPRRGLACACQCVISLLMLFSVQRVLMTGTHDDERTSPLAGGGRALRHVVEADEAGGRQLAHQRMR